MTEIDEEKLKTILKLKSDWEKKAQNAYDEYQSSGIQRYYSTYEKYRNYNEILDIAEQAIRNISDEKTKRFHNIDFFIENNITKDTYTKEEVKALIFKTIYF